jgi:acetyl-CoA C-acetyltransferase
VKIKGAGEATKNQEGGYIDLTYSGARFSGQRAFEEAGVKPPTSSTPPSTTASPSPC